MTAQSWEEWQQRRAFQQTAAECVGDGHIPGWQIIRLSLQDVMRSLASIEIDRPIDEVFTYTNEKVAEWSLTVVEDTVIEDKDGLGTTFLCVTEEHGRVDSGAIHQDVDLSVGINDGV